MNKEELKEFVDADANKIKAELTEMINSQFYGVLGVCPDTVDATKKQHHSNYYINFSGYKCTLDGADFCVGMTLHPHAIESYVSLYQIVTIKTFKKRIFKKIKTIENQEWIRINRPADIMV